MPELQVDIDLPQDVRPKVDAVTGALRKAARGKEAASFNGKREKLEANLRTTEQRLGDVLARQNAAGQRVA